MTPQRLIVLDFETTGLSVKGGDRAIEVGAVALQDGEIVDRFQSLINPGFRVDSFIENYTGISNTMLQDAPVCEAVIPQLYDFVADAPILAHNASFDRSFFDAEYQRAGYQRQQDFVCTMRIARRLYPNAPNHKLGTLVRYTGVPECGDFHRALADAEMTGHLWLAIAQHLKHRYHIDTIDLPLMHKLESMKIASAESALAAMASAGH